MKLFQNSQWIWADGFDSVNTYVDFFEEIGIKHPADCKLYLSVDTNYAFYLNDSLVEMGQYADYPFDKIYDKVDFSAYAKEGANHVRIRCWHQGTDSSTVRCEKAGVIYEIYEGETLLCGSSAKTRTAPVSMYDMGSIELVSGQLGFSFRYDARRVQPEAISAISADKPLPTRLRPIKKLVVGEEEAVKMILHGSFREMGGNTIAEKMQYAALAIRESAGKWRLPSAEGIFLKSDDTMDGIFAVIDTGRENAGILSLDIDLPEDALILVGWGEHLEDLRVRSYVGGRNFSGSYYGTNGRNRFVHPFRRLGMRYLQVHIYAKEAKIHYAGIRTTDYPLSHDVDFFCADNLHTKIHEVSKRTLLMSMHEHYEDCPWREQALYSMDSRNQMLCGYYCFKEYDFAKASLRLMAQSIRDDNMLELCSPARVSITIPSFSAIYLTQVYEYVQHSGDTAFLDEVLPVMTRIADEFVRRMDNPYGLIPCFTEERYWNFYERQSGLEGSIAGSVAEENLTYDAPLCGFVSFGLRSLSNTLKWIGREAEAQYYESKHLTLNEQINRYFWEPEKKAYASYLNGNGEIYHYAELTNSLLVYADAARGERLDYVLAKLAEKTLIPVTLSHSIFKYDAMMRKGSLLGRKVFADIAENWGSMLYQNATTFWETIDGASAFSNAGSLCHGWSAIPVYFYHKYAVNMNGADTGLYECRIIEKH